MLKSQVHPSRQELPCPPKPDRFAYSITDACYSLSISRSSLYEMIARAELKPIKIAGRTLIPRSELERLTAIEQAA
jgi:excisionase family DNA binding protein